MRALRASLLMPCIIGLLMMILVLFGIPALFSIKHTIISYDPLFSKAACSNIKEIITTELSRRFSHAQVHALPDKLPIVAEASARFKANGTAYYKVHAWEPLWHVNDDSVLLANNQMVERAVFAREVYKELPALCVRSQDEGMHAIIRKIPYELAQRYEITLVDEHLIYLHDKKDERFYIAAHEDTIGSFDTAIVDRVEKDILQKQLLKKNEVGWIIDIRFAGQILVRSHRGGVA